MTTKEDILEYVEFRKSSSGRPDFIPIYSLFLFTNPDKELIYHIGDTEKRSGFPDIGGTMEPGFYFDLDTAIEAMNQNACDMRETCYNAGFILVRFPGLYEDSGTETRMYFLWDEEKQGFYQQEEPAIFAHISY